MNDKIKDLNWDVLDDDTRCKCELFLDAFFLNDGAKLFVMKNEGHDNLLVCRAHDDYYVVKYPWMLLLYGVADDNGNGLQELEKKIGKFKEISYRGYKKIILPYIYFKRLKKMREIFSDLRSGKTVRIQGLCFELDQERNCINIIYDEDERDVYDVGKFLRDVAYYLEFLYPVII